MNPTEQQGVLKYLEVLDKFIKVKVLPKSIVLQPQPSNREQYRAAIISSCLNKQELIKLYNDANTSDVATATLEDILYEVCIGVNPHLDLQRVALLPPQKVSLTRPLHRNFFSLEKRLKERIIGQDEAIETVVRTLKRTTSGLREEYKPRGNFLFAGRSGTGKTELGKVLAKELEEYHLLHIDGSEFSLLHEHAKLIGSPPGYIGHSEGGILEKIREGPRTVLIWDEIEKAHDNTHNILLQVLDEGKVRSSQGEDIQFNHAINILTSNTGAEEADKYEKRVGFERDTFMDKGSYASLIKQTLETLFRPELLNRMDAICVFNTLGFEECCAIAALRLDELKERIREKGIAFKYAPQVLPAITNEAEYKKYGGREIKRVIECLIEDRIADLLVSRKDIRRITASYGDNKIRVEAV